MIWKILDWLACKLEDWSHAMHRLKWRWHKRSLPAASTEEIGKIVAATIKKHAPEIAANVANHNALYKQLTKKGK